MNPATPADPAVQTLAATRRLMWWLIVPVMVLLGLLTALQYRQGMADEERELLRRAGERAQELEALARPAAAHVHDLRAMLERQWHAPPDGGPALRRALAPRRADDGRPDGWSLDDAGHDLQERLGQLWWSDPSLPGPDDRWLRLAQAFNEQARIVHERSPGFVATWFAAAEVNLSFGYPFVRTGGIVAAMGTGTLAGIAEPRRAAVQRVARIREQNPDDIVFWGAPYVGHLDGALVMSHGASLVVDGRYVGEVSLDFRIDSIQAMAERWQRDGGHVWVVDAQRLVVADSAQPLRPPAPGAGGTGVQRVLASALPIGLGAADVDAALFAPGQVHRGQGWALATALRIGSPFTYVEAVPAGQLRARVWPALLPNALLAGALLLAFVLGQWLLARRFVAPALEVLEYLKALSRDPLAAPPRLGWRWDGWVAAVGAVFARQAELQRRERRVEAFKSAMFDHAPTGIVTTDGVGGGRIVEINDAACALFGVAREQAIGREAGEILVPPRHRAAHREAIERNRAGEKVAGFDRPLVMRGWRAAPAPGDGTDAGGHEFPMEIQTFRIQVEGEIHYTAFCTDLSERQQAADQIARQREALRQSEKLTAMGTLLAGVAHELNNPLAIVMGRASLLEDKTAGTDSADDARRIREAAERCGRIVRTFLNMARARPPQRSTVQVNDIARAAAEMLGYTLRSHGIELTLSLADDLPEVQADGDQIGQVVLNLVVNAQQALAAMAEAEAVPAEPGDPAARPRRPRRQPRIALATGVLRGATPAELRVWLRVADNGPGIPAALAERVFEPFFTTKAEGIGTGMGLAVSRGIAREHGGELALEGGFGGGAVFQLTLPISGTAAAAEATSAGAAPDPEAEAARILVVDDEAEIAEMLRQLLEGAGYETMTAESGAVALEMLEMAVPDAIVSDLRMPDIDGAALWRAVQERHPALAQRMLFVTGDTLSPGARGFLDASGCPSLEKPFARPALLAAVAQLLKR